MPASVTVNGLDPLLARVVRIRGGQLQKDLVGNLHKAASPIRADMASATFTRIQRKALGSVDVAKTGAGIDATGGRGGSVGAVLFPGAEFGGRKPRRVTYMSRSPLGRAYSIRRRTTMQFLPHLGKEGYFWWPTIREWMPRLHKQAVAIASKSLGGR